MGCNTVRKTPLDRRAPRYFVDVPSLSVVFLLYTLLLPGVLAAQDLETGLHVASEDLLRASRPANAPATTVEEDGVADLPERVDLSPMFLPPGNQGTLNSYGPWSVAYVAKTYLEYREHGWDPRDPAHQCSPS